MFLVDEVYSHEVKTLLSSDGPVDVAIAFWGRGAEDIIASSINGKRRIVCNLASGGTNPMVIRALYGTTNIEVRQDDSLHAKVLLGAAHGIVGSANFSANGLGFEGNERGNWVEAGFLLRDQAHLEEARRWFEKLWNSAQDIDEEMLVAAEESWRRNRIYRPKPRGDQFVIRSDNWRDYLHRNIYIIIWRKTPNAAENTREIRDRAQRDQALALSSGRSSKRSPALDYYHGWPRGNLSNSEATYIDVQYQQSGRAVCHGARRTLGNGHTSWPTKDGEGSMDAMQKIEVIGDQRFGQEQYVPFAAWIQPILHQHFYALASERSEKSATGGFTIGLDRLLEAAFIGNEERFHWLLQCCEMVSEKLGLRSVKIDTLVPQARIGLGERNLSRKKERALKRVSMLMWISGSHVICGSFLSKESAAQFGEPLERKGKAGRSWIRWQIEETSRILPALVLAATAPFIARDGIHPSEDFIQKWPMRNLVLGLALPEQTSTWASNIIIHKQP